MDPRVKGRLLWVLHAHLPFVRHPEHPRFFEEDWLFEAIETVYLPLLDLLEGWARDRVDARVCLSVSPPLLDMWQDDLLQSRFRAHLDRRSALWHDEKRRLRHQPQLCRLAEREAKRVAEARWGWERRGGELVSALAALAEAGVVELATTSATHALLPMFAAFPRFVRAQVRVGLEAHRRAFGRAAISMWLPECAWFEGAESVLVDAGVRATFLEGRGLLHGRPPAGCGVDRPIATARGLTVYGRDPDLARRVWSADVGLPGDPRYLDFHRDETSTLPEPWARPYALPTGARVPLGLRYHRVTDRRLAAEHKQLYEPAAAAAAVIEHAEQFGTEVARSLHAKSEHIGWPAVALAPFDAELFGHWWREGPAFVDQVARRAAGRWTWTTPSLELEREEPVELVQPAPSTWGAGGDASVWLAPETAGMWTGLLEAVADLESRPRPGRELARVHDQLAREVFLAASSDWPFLVQMNTAASYARARVEQHLDNARELRSMLDAGCVRPEVLERLELRQDIFPWMDYGAFA